ncbi:MAG: biotin operon repressor [Candidatus Coproplasma sp.]
MSIKSEVLKQLEAHRGEYVSGENLSCCLGVTRQAVWKAVKKLTEEGYIINSVTNRGYMLDGKCDLLSSAVIADRTGARVYCYDEVSSTNTAAMQKLCEEGDCVVVAERQTMGRTKSGGSFASPSKKGIYMSVGLRCNLPLEGIENLRGLCAERIACILCDCCGTMPEIRNIDELFLNGKKVCGILFEGEVNLSARTVKNLVIGIGVYTAEVGQTLGYISASEPRNALICSIYTAVKEIVG